MYGIPGICRFPWIHWKRNAGAGGNLFYSKPVHFSIYLENHPTKFFCAISSKVATATGIHLLQPPRLNKTSKTGALRRVHEAKNRCLLT